MASSDELVELLKELVRKPSCWDNPEDQRRLGRYIGDWFESHEIKSEVDELGNVIVNPRAPVIMNGHIDVVAPAGQADYNPKVVGGKMIGRGTTDMKGGIAVIMEVIKKLHEKYSGLGAVFQVTEESEYEKTGADILCERGVFDETKFIIEAEPSNLNPSNGKPRVIIGSEGAFDWSTKITTDDTAYHAGNLHLANNAILVAARYVRDLLSNRNLTVPLEQFKRSYRQGVVPKGKGPINVAKIEGGIQPTWTPNHCELEIEKRLFPTENWKTFHRQLAKHLSRVGRAAGAKMEIKVLWHADPFLLDTKSDGYGFVSKWAKRRNLEISFTSGASDLNKIYNFIKSNQRRKITGITLGPGAIGMAHRSDEFILLSGLDRFYHLYLDILKEIFEGDGRSLIQG